MHIFGSGATFSGHNVGEVEWVAVACRSWQWQLAVGWPESGWQWEVARVPKQLFPAGSILN